MNYKTGKAFKSSKTKTVITHTKHTVVIGGMTLGNCYKFRAFHHDDDFLGNKGTYAYNTPDKVPNVWKVGPGADGQSNTITIYDRTGRYGAMLYKKNTVRFYWNKWLNKKGASLHVGKGLIGKGTVSFAPAHSPSGTFLKIEKYKKGIESH